MALNRLEQVAFCLFYLASIIWLALLCNAVLPSPYTAILLLPLAFAFGWYARRLFAKFMRFSYWLAGDR